MKIAGGVDKEFAVIAEAELVVLEVVIIDRVDGVDEFDKVVKYKWIALS